jgi:cytochrome c
MSDLRFNAIAGTVLASLLGVLALNAGAGYLIAPHYPEKAGYMPDVETGGGGAGAEAPAGPPDWGTILADPAQLATLVERGDKLHAVCSSCHSVEPGGPNGTGPLLYDVFGRPSGSHAGFTYSAAMAAYGQPWSYDNLYAFLESPSRYISGTSMGFAGLRKSEDRVALVAYLHSLSPSPAPLPAPRPAEPAAATGEEGAAAPADAAPADAAAQAPAPG